MSIVNGTIEKGTMDFEGRIVGLAQGIDCGLYVSIEVGQKDFDMLKKLDFNSLEKDYFADVKVREDKDGS